MKMHAGFVPRSVVCASAIFAASLSLMGESRAALPAFTFDPSAVGLNGATFTADNLLVADYATVVASGPSFTENGYLNVTSALLGSGTAASPGLGSTYGLYIAFAAAGTTQFANATNSFGTIDSLSYTLYGYNGPGTFTPTSAPAPVVTLGSGVLDTSQQSTVSSTFAAGKVTSASANVYLTFAQASGASAFFVSPGAFFSLAESAFTNSKSEIKTTGTGFVVTQGGGTVTFVASPVPEPQTYAMFLGGLLAVGFVARRRRQ